MSLALIFVTRKVCLFVCFPPRDSLAMIVLGEFSENQVILDVSGGVVSRKPSKR